MVRALRFGHDSLRALIELQRRMAAEIGKPKREYEPAKVDAALAEDLPALHRRITNILATLHDRNERQAAVDELCGRASWPSTRPSPTRK